MAEVIVLPQAHWHRSFSSVATQQALHALEAGNVVLMPTLDFALQDDERHLLRPATAGEAKNISLDPASKSLRGATVDDVQRVLLQNVMMRFADAARRLLGNLLPSYASGLERARTSFRPLEIAGRKTSWRKDDSRLHVDSFPSSPTQGDRILRVFSNVNPDGRGRTWRLGEPFEAVAAKFAPAVRGPVWGASHVMNWLGITKRRRSPYDHFMLALHDRMKADLAYQANVVQSTHEFPSGSTWIVFSDQVSHAAMAGQYAFEQTFHLPVGCMTAPDRAPLCVLERVLGRRLT